MPEINYKNLNSYLKKQAEEGSGGFAPVYLLYGEEMLFKTALDELLSALVPGAERTRNYEPIDGDNQNISDAVDRVNTFSLFSGKKVVGLCDSQVFQSKQDTNQILEKAKQAFESDNIKKASGYLLRALGILNLSFEDITEQSLNKALNIEVSRKDAEWIMSLLDYCREKKLKVPGKGDGETAVLQEAIEKGFPKGNYLIITTETVDKRRALYKAIKENGVIIDCAVPKGDRKADKIEQGKVLNERKNAILKRNNKSMSNDAYLAMVQMAGFDLRTFVNNLEKLISFTGDRKDITVNDVRSVLQRTKQDPIYEFTNAITDRSLAKSLFYMHSLLKGPDIGHPLQLLGGIINQIRKLLNVKGFMKSSYSRTWYSGCSYNHFKDKVISEAQAYDQDVLNELTQWNSMISAHTDDEAGPAQKGRKKKAGPATDIVIVKNPGNAYPIYMMLKKAELFTTEELFLFIELLGKADFQLKSTGHNPEIVLEKVIFSICKVGSSQLRT